MQWLLLRWTVSLNTHHFLLFHAGRAVTTIEARERATGKIKSFSGPTKGAGTWAVVSFPDVFGSLRGRSDFVQVYGYL